MAVATVGTFTRTELVRRTALDPWIELLGSTISEGAAGGGNNVLTWTLPVNFAYLIIAMNCQISSSSTSHVQWFITSAGRTMFQSGSNAILVGTSNVPQCADPPEILFFEQPVTCIMQCDNVDTEDMNGKMLAYGWDLQTARNVPMKLMNPAYL